MGMEITNISEITGARKAGAVSKVGSVNVKISSDVQKIHDWVEALKAMPDMRDIPGPTATDPKKIAEAIFKQGW